MVQHFGETLSRRRFLQAGALTLGTTAIALAQVSTPRPKAKSCIVLFLVGGPSQLDTWDMKPEAPDFVRSPFRPVPTNVVGLQICEHFPRMARRADQFAIVRSVHHQAAAIHETGQQLMQTGRLCQPGLEHPHFGSVLSLLDGPRNPSKPPFVVLPGPIGNTGVGTSHGQGAGYLGSRHEPVWGTRETASESPTVRDRYGRTPFGESCLQARQLIEQGVRCVTVNMFDTVFQRTTWDCHAAGGALASTLGDYRDTLCPTFDLAYTALLDDLHERGLLSSTLVLAMGEFGRTPRLNGNGGRDHHPGCWSILFAGGGVRGGQVIGASDATASEPCDRPVSPAEVVATVYHALGMNRTTALSGFDGRALPLVDAPPIDELFR